MRTQALAVSFLAMVASAQQVEQPVPPPPDPVAIMVGRLDLERYKATIKGLTRFGDRRQGTDRNRAAVDWIEAQLKNYGCATERIRYTYEPPQPPPEPGAPPQSSAPPATAGEIGSGEIRPGPGGSRLRGMTRPSTANIDPG